MPSRNPSSPRSSGVAVPGGPVMIPQRTSLVDQTAEAIRQMISSGQWVSVLPGEEALRVKLSVSRVTLRKAHAQLMAQGWINAGGRGRNHSINHRIQGPSGTPPGATQVKCLAPFPEIQLVWSSRVIFDKIRQGLAPGGLGLEWEQQAGLWRENPEQRLRELTEASPATVWLLFRASPQIQQWFQSSGLPCVVLGPCHDGLCLPSVKIDYAALARHAAGEAWRLGHHHVALVVFDPAVASARHTMAGLQQSVLRQGQPGRVTVISDDLTLPGLRREMAAALQEADPPTCFLVSEGAQAFPVLGIFKEMGLRVPGDVSLIVRDYEPFLDRCQPAFSSYRSDWQRFGHSVARLLLQVATGGGAGTQRNIIPKFIPGETLVPRRGG